MVSQGDQRSGFPDPGQGKTSRVPKINVFSVISFQHAYQRLNSRFVPNPAQRLGGKEPDTRGGIQQQRDKFLTRFFKPPITQPFSRLSPDPGSSEERRVGKEGFRT